MLCALRDDHLEWISSMTCQKEMYRLGKQLSITRKQINASFIKNCSDPRKAIMEILTRWLKQQPNRKVAYIKMTKALTHPSVRLNLIAGEVLGYTPLKCKSKSTNSRKNQNKRKQSSSSNSMGGLPLKWHCTQKV